MSRQTRSSGAALCVAREIPGWQVVEHTLPPGRIAPHRVDRPLIAAVVSGRCETTMGGRRFENGEAHAWCEPAGEVRSNRVGGPGVRVLSALPDESDAAGLFEAVRPSLARPAQHRDPEIAISARRAWIELRRSDSAAPLALAGHVLVMLSAFARQAHNSYHAPRPGWLPRVSDYLRAHFREPLSLRDVAAVAAVDPAHLCRAFRAHTGTTVAEHVRRLRVVWAAGQVDKGELSLSVIALGAGFTDQSHFTKVFRRHLGLTPGAYRTVRGQTPNASNERRAAIQKGRDGMRG